jgi:hypothetical protein
LGVNDVRTVTPGRAPGSGWSAGRVVLAVVGAVLGLVGLGLLVGGAALAVAATQRDDGYFHTGTERFSSGGYALASDELDFGADVRPRNWGVEPGDLFRVRIRATAGDRDQPVFVGVGRTEDVDAFLDGVAHDVVDDVDLDPFEPTYRRVEGDRPPEPPGGQDFWVTSASGVGRQQVEWEPGNGHWTVVVMNADATRGVDADIQIGVELRHLWWIVLALVAAGAAVLASGVVLIVTTAQRASRGGPPSGVEPPPVVSAAAPVDTVTAVPVGAVPVGAVPPSPTADDPVVLEGRLEEPLSRWLWLVKWLLAIPHVIVLVFLWIAVLVLTFVAGVAILFTGRYPRGLFDFNHGVLRWTWRVAFYAGGVLGTDRYPPFSLDARPDDPATLEIQPPGELSRGLVLVKWWLLAIPHYVIAGVFGAGLWWGVLRLGPGRWDDGGWGDGGWAGWGSGGLIGILVLIAAVRLLFTGRYPREMFALVVGLHRWLFRVAAYALLMTDRYPPFRLDQGGEHPRTGREEAPTGSR